MKIDLPMKLIDALERLRTGDRTAGFQTLAGLKPADTPRHLLLAAIALPRLRPAALVALGYLRTLSPSDPALVEAFGAVRDLADGLQGQATYMNREA